MPLMCSIVPCGRSVTAIRHKAQCASASYGALKVDGLWCVFVGGRGVGERVCVWVKTDLYFK